MRIWIRGILYSVFVMHAKISMWVFVVLGVIGLIIISFFRHKCDGINEKKAKILYSVLQVMDVLLSIVIIPLILGVIGSYYDKSRETELIYDEAINYMNDNNYKDSHLCWEELIYNDPTNPRYYYQNGMTYYKEEEYEKAIELYENSLKYDSEDYNSYYYEALSYLCLQQYDNALTCISTALEKQPGNIKCILLRADIYYSIKDYNHAYEDYETVLNETNKGVILHQAYYREAICLFRMSDIGNSEVKIRKAINEKKLDKYKDFLELINRYNELKNNKSIHTLSAMGSSYRKMQWYEDSLACSMEIEALIDNNEEVIDNAVRVSLYFNTAYDYYALKQYNDSINYIDKTIELDDNPKFEVFRDIIQLEAIIDSGKDSVEIEQDLCKAYIEFGWISCVEDCCERILVYDPENEKVSEYRDLCEMQRYCDEMKSEENYDYEEVFSLIKRLYNNKMYYGCARECYKYKDYYADKAEFFSYYGCSLLMLKQYEDSIEQLEMAIKLDPDNEHYKELLSKTLEEMNSED